MFSLYDKVPGYLLSRYHLTATVVLTVLSSLLCLLLCYPFLSNTWFSLQQDTSFVFSLAFFALSILFATVSRHLMCVYAQTREMRYLAYILWQVGEVLVISLLYTLFTSQAVQSGYLDSEGVDYNRVFAAAMLFCIISIGGPTVIAALYSAIRDKDNTIRLMNYGNVVSDMELSPTEEKRITLFDNSGALKFSITSDNLYFIESDDNYVQVWYVDGSGQLKQYMLRCRLKTIEDSFADSDLVRCHRKYVINIKKVKILTSEKDGYYVDLDLESTDPIPVSKTYEQQVLSRFNSR